jgi:hypothetical protein
MAIETTNIKSLTSSNNKSRGFCPAKHGFNNGKIMFKANQMLHFRNKPAELHSSTSGFYAGNIIRTSTREFQ